METAAPTSSSSASLHLNQQQQHHLAVQISSEIQSMLEYSSFYHELQKVTASDDVNLVGNGEFQSTLVASVKSSHVLNVRLKNMVYQWLRLKCTGNNDNGFRQPTTTKESLDYMKKFQENWENRIYKSLTTMAHELKTPLACGRLISEQETVEEGWAELSQWDVDLARFKPVYSPKDFLDCLLHIVNPNYKGNEKVWGSLFAAIPIRVKTLRELKCVFRDLTTGEPHFGLIRHLESQTDFYYGSYLSSGIPKIIQLQRMRLGEAVIANGSAIIAQEFLKKGCPPALREKLWQIVLGSNITQQHRDYYQQLKQAVVKSDLLVDRLILKDVQLTAANDDQYFVFEDSLVQALLCFTRDTELLDLFDRSSKNPMTACIKRNRTRLSTANAAAAGAGACTTGGGGGGSSIVTTAATAAAAEEASSVIYPPNGVIPFHGFTMYVAPICYLFDDPIALYFTFRSLYCRFWFRLHEIGSHENGIVALCILFEKLMQRHENQLWFHFRTLRISPLRVVFKWLMKGFSGYLPAEQVLQLWDLVLAYNSVQLLSFFALGILSVRKENLMRATQPHAVDAVLADLSSVAVMPVVQLVLYKETA